MEYRLLTEIFSPEDVKKLGKEQLNELCAELRECIIDTVSKNGGHLASNLGAVELTVALHRAFSSPEDSIIFDVGHQSYAHKLITGRFERFSTLRTEGGISGFMRPDESIHDPFVTGHSSNSISAAYGIYRAKAMRGESGTSVAVIGDGAMTGGLAYEALNNAGSGRSNFIVVLNDNKMSISRNVGALARTFTKLRNRSHYHTIKFAVENLLIKIPLIGKTINRAIFRLKEVVKSAVYRNNLFASLGFNYLGPVDGHDIAAMEALFKAAQSYNRPSLIHVITTKGKGYPYAENNPKNYHGVSPFDIEKGADGTPKRCFSDVAGETLCKLAEKDTRICAVTAAMTVGTGLSGFSSRFKNRFFDVGIAEAHAVTFSAGLATGGMIPFFAVYSSFLQRGFDQIIHDAAIGGLPIKILVDRAGIVGEDGESHQGVFDAAFLSSVPNMNIYSPCFYDELEELISSAAQDNRLCAIRYPRGGENLNFSGEIKGDFTVVGTGNKNAAITYGRLFSNAVDAFENTDVDIIKMNRIYPVGSELIEKLKGYGRIHFFEEGVLSGGIAEHIGNRLLEAGFKGEYTVHAIDGEFVPSMSVGNALRKYGLDSESMKKSFEDVK